MKKMLLAAVGLSGLLASCGGVVVVSDANTTLQLTSYSSEYRLPAAYTDTSTGTTYPAGSSYICRNLSTRLYADLDWNGTFNQFGARLRGRDTNTVTNWVYTPALSNITSSNPTSIEVTVGAGVAPLSVKTRQLSAQAIVVTPVNSFTVVGATFIELAGFDSYGVNSNIVKSVQALPVANCTL